MGFLRRGRIGTAHNGGRAQIGMDFQEAYYDIWAINMLKQSLGVIATGTVNNDWPALYNSDGYPTAMPSGGGSWIFSQVYVYGNAGDKWILDWEGTSNTVAITFPTWSGCTFNENVGERTNNKRTYTIAGTPTGTESPVVAGGPMKVTVTVSAIGTGFGNVRLYRDSDTSNIAGSGATSIFTTEFLNRIKQFGVIRFMDWNRCNTARTYKWDYRNTEASAGWSGFKNNGAWYYGAASPTATSNTFTVSTLPTLTNGMPVQFVMTARPNKLAVSAVTVGNPTQFTITAHGFSGGEKVFAEVFADGGGPWTAPFQTKDATTGLSPEFTVTRIDDNTISLPINSTGFAAPGTMNLLPSINISDGTITKRCYRKGLGNHTYSEFGGSKTYPFLYTAIYDSLFDCFVMSGDGEGDTFYVGTPLSAIVTLANYCRAHPWFTYPYMADDDFWTQVSTYVKANLSPGLTPRFEPGNEIWNTGAEFWQTNYAQSVAVKTYPGTSTSSGSITAWNLGYAKRIKEVQAAIEAVYGTGNDWQMVLGSQQGGLTTERMQGNATINGGSSAGYPANKADYVATAPYTSPIFGGASGNSVNYPGLLDQIDNFNQGGASRDTAYAWLTAEMSTASTLGWKAFPQTLDDCIATVGSQATVISGAGYTGRRGTGLPQTHYEGGPTQFRSTSFTSAGYPANAPTSGRSVTYANLQSFWLGWLASDGAGEYYTDHFTRMAAAGIVYPSQFTIARPWTTTTNQGLINMANLNAIPTIPAYTALLNWNNGV
jgi:hypothetical protein